jgi:hypothetical protein
VRSPTAFIKIELATCLVHLASSGDAACAMLASFKAVGLARSPTSVVTGQRWPGVGGGWAAAAVRGRR